MRERSGGRGRAGTSVAEERVGVGSDERGGRGGGWAASTDHYRGLGLEAKAWGFIATGHFFTNSCLLGTWKGAGRLITWDR